MSKSKNRGGGFVYSTNPNFQPTPSDEASQTPPNEEQMLSLHREKKGRAGKAVVLIKGFQGSASDMLDLAKQLKAHCGSGGSLKGDEIVIQGDQREKVKQYLESKGYGIKLVGG